jgi:hypothetical protein
MKFWNLWKIWCDVVGYDIQPGDKFHMSALIRTLWLLLHIIASVMVIANVIHHW